MLLNVKRLLFISLLLTSTLQVSIAQNTNTVVGFVLDSSSREVISFASLNLKGALEGTVTNTNGFFRLQYNNPADSICISEISYASKCVALPTKHNDTLIILLSANAIHLNAIHISPGVNPAH